MKLKHLTLENFRACEQLDLELGSRLTVLLGNNGSGKTSVLDSIAIGLGAVLTHLPSVSDITFRKQGDIRQQHNLLAPYTRIGLEMSSGLRWDRIQRRDKSQATAKAVPPATGLKTLESYLDETVINPLNAGQPFQLPMMAYYGVSRAVLEVPLRRKNFPKTHTRLEALSQALAAQSSFKLAFIWFYNKENEEHRLQKEQRSFEVTLPELDAVRRAIGIIFPDISNPHIELSPLRFVVTINGETLDLMQLSDGYKTLLGLVIDLSMRMGLANPHLTDPLSAEAIVMIDEVDLHLHPSWQQRVMADLLRTFTRTQFILTTHSPFVVEALNNHLKRHRLGSGLTDVDEIDKLLPLPADQVRVYLMENSTQRPLIDSESGLIDDTLLAYFNQINVLYDRMRDIEWNRRND
ncbi:AAA family ATPase [Desulfoprunum benzoelyticum]|uniref:Putative ATP-binding protein involved in virulence n=1 Tax=Desulfoprunum benzoelyticum TaxID=1506996 RepID=A0A840V1D8_9BACT|nr:AAA family ATPase [Desulfoprunum benzoelyticum]MBB5347001.1 putative ATP-binding protein involved in virulence [Desulfoprunum benzoelyticum]MBM9531631.1 AAA family ATPase [Desulfoprunum benzoelyticum]